MNMKQISSRLIGGLALALLSSVAVAAQTTVELPITARLWDVRPGAAAPQLKAPLAGHSDDVTALAFSPDGKILATAGDDKKIILWDAATGKPEPGELRSGASPHEGEITSIAFSPDGRYVVSGAEDKTVKLWDLSDNTKPPRTLEDHKERGGITSVAYSPRAGLFASASRDGTLIFWNVSGDGSVNRTGEPRKLVAAIYALAFSPDGKRLAIACGDNMIRLWDVNQGKVVYTLRGHDGAVTSVAFSHDGKQLASGSEDDTIKLWNPQSEQAVKTLTGHASSVTSVAFGKNGQLISGGWDGAVRLWNPAMEKPTRVIKVDGYCITSVAFSADGQRFAGGSVYALEGAQRLFILSIGLKDYPPPLTLPAAQKGAVEVANVIERGGQRLFKGISKHVILNEQGTLDTIAAAFKEISQEAGKDDVFVFYYAGRRALVQREGSEHEYYLAPISITDIKNEATLSAKGIPVALFKKWLDSIPAQKQLLMLDSADLDQINGMSFLNRVWGVGRLSVKGRDIFMMSLSIDEGEQAKLQECGEQTPFTCFALEGLREGKADTNKSRKVITTDELNSYLITKLGELSAPEHRAVHNKWGMSFPILSLPEKWDAPERWRGKKVRVSDNPNVGPLVRGKSYALLIATSEYDDNDETDGEDDDDGWDQLPNAIRDAERIKRTLESQYRFEKVELLQNADFQTMWNKIEEYKKMKHDPEDQLLIYFAGHGIENEEKEGYIVARNAKYKDDTPTNKFAYSDLRAKLDLNDWRHVLVILDVCYGGNFNPDKSKNRSDDPDSEETRTPHEIVNDAMPLYTRRFIASGAQTVKDGFEGGMSPFTNHFLSVLRWGRNQGAAVSEEQIIGELKRRALKPKPIAGPFGKKDDPGGDFVFFAK